MHIGILKFNHKKYTIECDSISEKIMVKKENINFHIQHNKVEFIIIEKINEHCVEAKIINQPNYQDVLFCGIVHHFYKTDIFVFSEKFNNQFLIKIPFHQDDSLSKMDIIQFKITQYDQEGFKGLFIKKIGNYEEKNAMGEYIQDIFNINEKETSIDYHYHYKEQIEIEKKKTHRFETIIYI